MVRAVLVQLGGLLFFEIGSSESASVYLMINVVLDLPISTSTLYMYWKTHIRAPISFCFRSRDKRGGDKNSTGRSLIKIKIHPKNMGSLQHYVHWFHNLHNTLLCFPLLI